MLIDLGITPNLQGFYYILEAVERFNPNESYITLYSKVAIKHHTNKDNVERCIRYAFSKMDELKRKSYFETANNNTELISIIVWKERVNYGEKN